MDEEGLLSGAAEDPQKIAFDGIVRSRTNFPKTSLAKKTFSFKVLVPAQASVAQLVEHHLAKVNVEGSNPFARSIFSAFGNFPAKQKMAPCVAGDSISWGPFVRLSPQAKTIVD